MKKTLLYVLFAFQAGSLLFGGVGFVVSSTELITGETSKTEMHAQWPWLKIEIPPGEGEKSEGSMTYNAERKELIVNQGSEAYRVTENSFKSHNVQSFQPQLDEIRRRMAEAYEKVPKDQLHMLDGLIPEEYRPSGTPYGQSTNTETEIRKTNRKGKENGFSYTVYEVWRGGRKIFELHVTDWGEIINGNEVRKLIVGFAEFLTDLQDSMMGGKDNPFSHNNMFTYFKKVDGYISGGKDFEDNSSFQLVSVEKRKFPPGYFAVKGPVRDMGAAMGSLQGDLYRSMQQRPADSGNNIRKGYPRYPTGGSGNQNRAIEGDRAVTAPGTATSQEGN